MVYQGRIVAGGMTPSGKPFAAYAISGRKPPSKGRRFELFEDRIYVGPIGAISPEQDKMKDLIFYNCMRSREDGMLFVTNGAQTDTGKKYGKPVPNFFSDFNDHENALQNALRIMFEWGYENDKPIYTPRIAMVRYPDQSCIFSIVTKDIGFETATSAAAVVAPENGACLGLATYKGENNEAQPWSVDKYAGDEVFRFLLDAPLYAGGPEYITEQLYNFVDPEFVVASAGAVFDGTKWVMSKKNRFSSEEEFKDYCSDEEKRKKGG